MEDIPALPEIPESGPAAALPPKPKRKAPPRKRKPAVAAVIMPPTLVKPPAKAAPKPAPPPEVEGAPMHLRLYWKIAASLAALSAIVLVFVLYLIFSKAVITIVPKKQEVAAEIRSRVMPSPAEAGSVRGVYKEAALSSAKTIPIQGGGSEVEGVAVGTVTLFNTTVASQALVATTRLQSPVGVLFRLKNQVNIPAKGRVDAEVYADKPGAAGNLGPTRFIIPGLREALQDDIYAASSAPMTGGVRTVKVVTQADIDAAISAVEGDLRDQAVATLRVRAGESANLGGELLEVATGKKETDAAVGTESSEVKVTVEVTVKAVFYDKNALLDALRAKLLESASGDQELVGFDPSTVAVSLVSGDAAAGSAVVAASGKGVAVIKANSSAFDKAAIAGLSKARVIEYFRSNPAVESVEVKFKPFWVRRVPGAKDHIEIIIKQS